jgi:Na+-driven multidrug efflux pump
MWYAFVAYVVVALPLGYALMFTFHRGVEGMWVSFIIALTMAAVMFHLRFRSLTKGLY